MTITQNLVAACHTVLHVAFLAPFMVGFEMVSPLNSPIFYVGHDIA